MHSMLRRPYQLTVLTGSFVLNLLVTLGSLSAQIVEFPDPELEKVIRHHLGIPDRDITVTDMASLIELDASALSRLSYAAISDFYPVPIQSLEGLQTAANLESIDLSGYVPDSGDWLDCFYRPNISFDSFTTLGSLHNLTMLNLSDNNLQNLTLPTGLTSIVLLDLSGNDLVDLILPAGLAGLTWLDLSGNRFTGLSVPSGLSNLIRLYLGGNQLAQVSLPEGLSDLIWLDLSGNQLTSLTLPDGVSNLATLDLGGNRLTSLYLPAGLVNLSELDLSGNALTDVLFLAGLSNLTALDLGGNQFTSLALPDGLSHLATLDLFENDDLTAESLEVPESLSDLWVWFGEY